MDGSKMIGDSYRIVKPLFQTKGYLYAQICCLKNHYAIANAVLYVYENEDPSQTLKMLSEKLGLENAENSNLIFPHQHIKDRHCDKNISLFLLQDYVVPLRFYAKNCLSIPQTLQILHGALSCLHQMHMRDVVHGNIAISTCYLVRHKQDGTCKFALNILDTSYFTEEECSEGIEDSLFESEGQSQGLGVSFKDDLQSLVYVMAHLVAQGKVFTPQRFQLEWVTNSELLRWKGCEFFKEMMRVLPPELHILMEIYTIAKSLRRNEKPDYLKLMKKVLLFMNKHNRIEKQKKGSLRDTNNRSASIGEKDIKIHVDRESTHKSTKLKENRP